MVQALFFDLGNVLVPFDYERFYRGLEPHSNLLAAEIAARFEASGLSAHYETGAMSSTEFYEACCRALGVEMPFESFAEAWSSIFDTSANFDDGFFSALASRYTLVLLSNTNELHFEFISRQFPWVRFFHQFALSFRVGEKKPGHRIYHAAVEMAGVKPADAFYADDIAEYVGAARSLGINHSVLFTKPSLLIEAMAAAGIRVEGASDASRRDGE